jgi:hypothetical protein
MPDVDVVILRMDERSFKEEKRSPDQQPVKRNTGLMRISGPEKYA